jgi:hypothetical protein
MCSRRSIFGAGYSPRQGAHLSFLEKKGSKEKSGKTVSMANYTTSMAAESFDSPARRAQTGGTRH